MTTMSSLLIFPEYDASGTLDASGNLFNPNIHNPHKPRARRLTILTRNEIRANPICAKVNLIDYLNDTTNGWYSVVPDDKYVGKMDTLQKIKIGEAHGGLCKRIRDYNASGQSADDGVTIVVLMEAKPSATEQDMKKVESGIKAQLKSQGAIQIVEKTKTKRGDSFITTKSIIVSAFNAIYANPAFSPFISTPPYIPAEGDIVEVPKVGDKVAGFWWYDTYMDYEGTVIRIGPIKNSVWGTERLWTIKYDEDGNEEELNREDAGASRARYLNHQADKQYVNVGTTLYQSQSQSQSQSQTQGYSQSQSQTQG